MILRVFQICLKLDIDLTSLQEVCRSKYHVVFKNIKLNNVNKRRVAAKLQIMIFVLVL